MLVGCRASMAKVGVRTAQSEAVRRLVAGAPSHEPLHTKPCEGCTIYSLSTHTDHVPAMRRRPQS